MLALDVQTGTGQIIPMMLRPSALCVMLICAGAGAGCRGNERGGADSTQVLPPVFQSGPLNTGWNSEAGPLMIVSSGGSDIVGVVLPEATDCTIGMLDKLAALVAGFALDLF